MKSLTLNSCKDETMVMCKLKGWDTVSIPNIWMFLTEEIGELASAIRRSSNQFSDRKKSNVENELMDVLSYLFQIAHMHNIDLDKAWDKYKSRKT